MERTIRERRIAGAENHVLSKIAIELGLERRLDVDRRQHAEALRLERLGRACDGNVERERDRSLQPITCFFHRSSLLAMTNIGDCRIVSEARERKARGAETRPASHAHVVAIRARATISS